MDNNVRTICVTGHRPKTLCGYNPDAYKELVRHLTKTFTLCSRGTPIRVLSMGKPGFDQLVFWAVENVKRKGLPISNELMLPEHDISKTLALYRLIQQKDFQLMLRHADNIHSIESDGSLLKTYENIRNMVDMSTEVFALHNSINHLGTTPYCINYAAEQKKPVTILSYDKTQDSIIPMTVSAA